MSSQEIDIESIIAELDSFDFEGFWALKKLRRDRPWTYDIIRVLWGRPTGLDMRQLYHDVWAIRHPTELPMPEAFRETIRRMIYDHTSCGAGTAKPDDDLFFPPKGVDGLFKVIERPDG